MNSALSSIDELPADYVGRLVDGNLQPLWPSLREALPLGRPNRQTIPTLWRYADVRPNLLRAGELAPIEKAERRVLVLCNPGWGLENLRATATIFIGLQLVLPGELPSSHCHTPAAIRFVIEGGGGYTVVNGEKLPMEPGDLILTPSRQWHWHGHDGAGPLIWLDALDLPLMVDMEVSYRLEGKPLAVEDPHNRSYLRYGQGGIIPYSSLTARHPDCPLLRFPWRDVRSALDELAAVAPTGQAVHVAYVNPENGQECLPTLGFSALRLSVRVPVRLPRRSASAIIHVVEGSGVAQVDGNELRFSTSDTIAVPTHADLLLEASGDTPAYLFMVDDAPLQRKLGIYHLSGELDFAH